MHNLGVEISWKDGRWSKYILEEQFMKMWTVCEKFSDIGTGGIWC
jgi:hypothetical protein